MQAFSMEGELGEGGKFLDWSASGDSFVIKDKHHFEKNILVQHFRHCNFSSFVRQLNKYGFKKVSLFSSLRSPTNRDSMVDLGDRSSGARRQGQRIPMVLGLERRQVIATKRSPFAAYPF
jgi:hypothetical protein